MKSLFKPIRAYYRKDYKGVLFPSYVSFKSNYENLFGGYSSISSIVSKMNHHLSELNFNVDFAFECSCYILCQ
jgi:hypothetical protein